MTFNKYASKVVLKIPTSATMKKRIKEDLILQLEEMGLRDGIDDPSEALGSVDIIASQFTENLDPKDLHASNLYEYKSEATFLGLPLIHVRLRKSKQNLGITVAKGIIAVGDVSIGLISIGGASLGLISFGGISFGFLLALGGFALSTGISLGGISIGYLIALGGLSISQFLAIGGSSIANLVAIGDYAQAKVCGYSSNYKGSIGVNLQTSSETFIPIIKEHIPNMPKFLLKIIEFFI